VNPQQEKEKKKTKQKNPTFYRMQRFCKTRSASLARGLQSICFLKIPREVQKFHIAKRGGGNKKESLHTLPKSALSPALAAAWLPLNRGSSERVPSRAWLAATPCPSSWFCHAFLLLQPACRSNAHPTAKAKKSTLKGHRCRWLCLLDVSK